MSKTIVLKDRIDWTVRLVEMGDRLGQGDELFYERSEPSVEFYDQKNTFNDGGGELVATYPLNFLIDHSGNLELGWGVPPRRVSRESLRILKTFLIKSEYHVSDDFDIV